MSNQTELESAKAEIKRLQEQVARNRRRDPLSLGYQIWMRRTRKGLSMDQMPSVSNMTISFAERGQGLRVGTLKRIANDLGCQAWEIVKDWEDANP